MSKGDGEGVRRTEAAGGGAGRQGGRGRVSDVVKNEPGNMREVTDEL